MFENELKLTDEGDSSSFLGAQFKKFDIGALELTQPHLFQRIIEALGLLEECKKHDTPSDTTSSRNSDSKPRKQSWNCRSSIRMLNV